MPLSKQEKFDIVASMMQNREVLCPYVFDDKGKMLDVVRHKLLELVEFVKREYLGAFPLLEIKDVTLNGSLCSYMYTDKSDMDLFIVVGDLLPQDSGLSYKILNAINLLLSDLAHRPYIYGHPIDFGMLQETSYKISNINCYSILQNDWKIKPVKRKFAFTAEELYQHYCKYSADLHKFVNDLPKNDSGFLTSESQRKLQDKLKQLNNGAFRYKFLSPEHEYCLEYNLYRLLKKFGTYRHFNDYVSDSYNNTEGKHA